MDERYLSYLKLLDELHDHLSRLTDLARQKIAAVQKDDLQGLDQVLKQEQALSLTFRGLEHKRTQQATALGLTDVPLSQLSGRYPDALRTQAKQTADRLMEQYRLYQGVSSAARDTLESNLHVIEKILDGMEGGAPGGAGYEPPSAQLPNSMKTDFRA